MPFRFCHLVVFNTTVTIKNTYKYKEQQNY